MKNTSYSHFHGYINSNLDNMIRICLKNGQVAALKITPSGIEGALLGQPLRLPEELHLLNNVSQLVDFLKSHRLGLNGPEIIIEGQIQRTTSKEIKTSPPISIDEI